MRKKNVSYFLCTNKCIILYTSSSFRNKKIHLSEKLLKFGAANYHNMRSEPLMELDYLAYDFRMLSKLNSSLKYLHAAQMLNTKQRGINV